ncbi:MAG TPA: hypothetical protein DGG95_12985 [Cytophagales bacterium]|jgi:hypothetical protein|nr:hypothetical protein [Cytophagales bacterium]
MKTKKVRGTVAKGLASILLSLSITKPSGRTKTYLKKIVKKLTKHLKADGDKALKRKRKKVLSPKVVKASTKDLKKIKKRVGTKK